MKKEKIYQNDNKTIIALQKEYTVDDEYLEVYDLYDNKYNLLFANVHNIEQCGDLLSFRRWEMIDRKELYKILNDSVMYKYYNVIINFDYEKLFENEDDKKSEITYNLAYYGYNAGIKKGLIEERHYKTLNGQYSYCASKNVESEKRIHIFMDEKTGLYLLADNDFNFINTDCKNISFSEYYEKNYYYFVQGFKVYVCDFRHNILASMSYFSNINDE